jgi:hypothetical protein
MLFLYLRELTASEPASAASAAEFALLVAAGFAGYGALALTRPNVAHLGMFLAVCAMCAGVIGVLAGLAAGHLRGRASHRSTCRSRSGRCSSPRSSA